MVENATTQRRKPLIHVNKKPNEPLDATRAEFIKYIVSKDGQSLTEKGGYYPITNEIRI
jgi:phosphate transport system substrate-binding protein